LPNPPRHKASRKPVVTGIAALDSLAQSSTPTIDDYVSGASAYVLAAPDLSASTAKIGQIALSAGLARAIVTGLVVRLPKLHAYPRERTVAGALRTARADVSESHELDGLRLAIELKPINLAVGRAVWNRFGDVRTFAVNIHLKFPFAVVAAVLTVPTFEWKTAKPITPVVDESTTDQIDLEALREIKAGAASRASTRPVIARLASRLARTRARLTEVDPPHLLEAVALIVYDPDTGTIDPDLPAAGQDLRWEEFLNRVAETYRLRFEIEG
jgi:hypothetical protein